MCVMTNGKAKPRRRRAALYGTDTGSLIIAEEDLKGQTLTSPLGYHIFF